MTPVRAVLRNEGNEGRGQPTRSPRLSLSRTESCIKGRDGERDFWYSLVVLNEPSNGLVDSLLERSELEGLDSLGVDEPEKLLVRCGLSELSVRLGGVELEVRRMTKDGRSALEANEEGEGDASRKLTLYSPVNPMDLTTASATVLMETSSSSPTAVSKKGVGQLCLREKERRKTRRT